MPEAPSLAVIIPAYNAERFLERAVESVFATGYPGVEVAIVDDGSTDGTLTVARDLERRWAGQCRVLRHPNGAQLGVSASRNLGIESTTTDWISFLDADDEYLPHRFDDFLSALDRAKDFDAMYGMAEIRYEEGGVGPAPNATEQFGIRESLTGSELLARLLEGRTWAISAITIKRLALGRAGVFDTAKRIAEDCHLWFRLAVSARIIAGSADRPMSIYWRHGANTYTYEVAHRLSLLESMLDAWAWVCRGHGHEAGGLAGVFGEGVKRYALSSLVAAKQVGARETFMAILWTLAKRRPSLLATRMIFRIAVRSLLFPWPRAGTPGGHVAGQ